MYKILGEFLKCLRLERKLTQAQVAAKLGISRQAYAYYEHSASTPDLSILLKLASLYQISLDTFFKYYQPDVSTNPPPPLIQTSYEQAIYPEFLAYYTQEENMKKYHYLNQSEKKLLFLFQKLPEPQQQELLLWTYFKSVVYQNPE